MQLTNQQIESLYKFTKDHYVEWYDLQCELVDHLTNDIEEMWKTNPKLSFESAKNKSFKKFGVCGFMDVIDKRRLYLTKRYNKMIWKEFKNFLTLPKVIISITFILFFRYIIELLTPQTGIFVPLSLLFLSFYPLRIIFKNKKEIKKNSKHTGKKWYFEDIIGSFGNFGSFAFIPFQFSLFSQRIDSISYYESLFFACIITLYSIYIYIIANVIPQKIRVILVKEHPEYQII